VKQESQPARAENPRPSGREEVNRIPKGAVLPPEAVGFLQDNDLRRVVYRNESLAHQIVVQVRSDMLAVSCNCLRYPSGSYAPIAERVCWQPDEAWSAWLAHLPAEEVAR
jgi:hypothetical protein